MKKRFLSIIFFYIFVFIIVYFLNPVLFSFLGDFDIKVSSLIISLFTLFSMLFIIYGILKINKNKTQKINVFKNLGITRRNLKNSFLLSCGVATPISLFWIIGIKITNINKMMIIAKPVWINLPITNKTLIFAFFFWALLYNTPLITGKFDPFDIVIFGVLFTFVYHKTGNSIGIIIAYLLNENPYYY